ncbi:MAG: hypothetical protein QXR62_04575 [Candidatus Bathyarchaeia archaeon]
MNMEGWIDVEVRDRDGRIIQKGKHEMHSFLNNLLRMFLGWFNASGGTPPSTYGGPIASTPIVDTAGSTVSVYIENYAVITNAPTGGGGCPICCKAPAGDGSYGILVGSGTGSISLDQYNLVSPIPQGTGSGQLDYRETSVDDLGVDTNVIPPTYRWRIRRSILNSSDANITFSEVGLFARSYWKDGAAVRQDIKYILGRDVLSTPYTIPAGGSATVAITVEVKLG